MYRGLYALPFLILATNLLAAEQQPVSIAVERPENLEQIRLAGPEQLWQLVVTGRSQEGHLFDATGQSRFVAAPEGVIAIDQAGRVTPRADGRATVTVKAGNAETRVDFVVEHVDQPRKLDFVTDVAPLFTRYGCNSGGCHGKKGGQEGFELALLGFEPHPDYDRLVNEDGGYRIDPDAPDDSLLLLKATAAEEHAGGRRFDKDSTSYRLLRRWIAEEAPLKGGSDAVVERIEVQPLERLLPPGSSQPLVVAAHLSDGSIRDVTHLVTYESNQPEMLTVGEEGLVTSKDRPGIAAVMVRYQTHIGVFRAVVPTGKTFEEYPQPLNFIDDAVFAQLRKLGIPASETCDDRTFIRRATIDLAGRLPTLEETESFEQDSGSEKHEKLIDRLLDSEEYADYFAGKWAALLRNQRSDNKEEVKRTAAFHAWIRDGLRKNRPYNEFVRDVLLATDNSPAAVWYISAGEPSAQVEDAAQLFLGQRIQCARCHHHPLEKWSQHDYYGMTAFFSRVEVTEPSGKGKSTKLASLKIASGKAEAEHPDTGEKIPPTPLEGASSKIDEKQDPRESMAHWMTDPQNRFFARTLVNRYWKHFLGLGLVEPEDDMRATNPAANPELLDALAKHFVESDFDLRALSRAICTSRTYRLSSAANGINLNDRQNYSRFLPRRLHAEVLLDAIDTVTSSASRLEGGVGRAVLVPDNVSGSYFLNIFGRPKGQSVCECERSSAATLTQQLHMLNSPEMLEKVSGRRADDLAKDDDRSAEEKIHELYGLALSRQARSEELKTLAAHLAAGGTHSGEESRQAWADILWALINTKEFQFNH